MPWPIPTTLEEMQRYARRQYQEDRKSWERRCAALEQARIAGSELLQYYESLQDGAAYCCLLAYCIYETLLTITTTEREKQEREVWSKLRYPLLDIYTCEKERYKQATSQFARDEIYRGRIYPIEWMGLFVLNFYVESYCDMNQRARERNAARQQWEEELHGTGRE